MPLLRDAGLLGPPQGPMVLAAGLSHDRHRLAMALVSIPEQIRGYGHVKQAHLDKAMKR
jgi:indolepyruvate ferredoxin oxidoreductase